MSKVTVETPSVMSTLTVDPLGATSPDQLLATLQFPEAPKAQVSVVWAWTAGTPDRIAKMDADTVVFD
jgi:hypothetical protein